MLLYDLTQRKLSDWTYIEWGRRVKRLSKSNIIKTARYTTASIRIQSGIRKGDTQQWTTACLNGFFHLKERKHQQHADLDVENDLLGT